MLDQLSVGATAGNFSPFMLFMEADIVVKAVMIGLLLASVWTWTIIVSFAMNIAQIARKSDRFERAFAKTENLDKFFDEYGQSSLPSAKVLAAGVKEWRRSLPWAALPPLSVCSERSGASCAVSRRSPQNRIVRWR